MGFIQMKPTIDFSSAREALKNDCANAVAFVPLIKYPFG